MITLLVLFAVLLALNHAAFVFAQEYLQKNNINYSKIEGSLFNGISIYDIKYKNILSATSITLHYKLLSLIADKPVVRTLESKNLVINMDAIEKNSNKNDASMKIIPFKIEHINLLETLLVLDKKHYSFDVKLEQLAYNKAFNVKNISTRFNTPYASGILHAKVVNNKLYGHLLNLVPSHDTQKNYLNFLEKTPSLSNTTIQVDKNSVVLHTNIDLLTLKGMKDVVLYNQDINLIYEIKQQHISIKSNYNLEYKQTLVNIKQKVEYSMTGNYGSHLHVTLIKHSEALPIKTLDISLRGNRDKIVIDANASNYKLHAVSDDYNKFGVSISNNTIKVLKDDILSLKTNATMSIKPLVLHGTFTLLDKYAKMKGSYTYKKSVFHSHATTNFLKTTQLYKKYNLANISPLDFQYKREENEDFLSVSAKNLDFSMIHKDNIVKGKGNFASASINMKGDISKSKSVLYVNMKIASLRKFLATTKFKNEKEMPQYDGAIDCNATLDFSQSFALKSTLFAPWISVKTDSQTKYIFNNIKMQTKYKDARITIKDYQAEYQKFKLYAKQPSQIILNKDGTISVNKFYIYDNLVLYGNISPTSGDMQLHLNGHKFHIATDTVNLTANADINISVQKGVHENIDGNVTLLDGVVSYTPPPNYSVSDDDIIIVQDEKQKESSALALNIHVSALKPIKYKTKQANVDFIPNINILKKSHKTIKYIGKISIVKGKVFAQGKEFDLLGEDKNTITLYSQKLNPQLNLVLHYTTLDYKEIFIRITNTLASPVIILSSNPPMSQNDIMSYILFGEAATSVFDTNGASKISLNFLLFGTGLKNIFKQSTGIKVDTLNILNNADGRYGYEVGAKLSNNIRVVYKNDITSSVIVQYGLTKSIRVDVDIHDAGQGVYLIYVKDMK
jgi:translocation and assembly module TamB